MCTSLPPLTGFGHVTCFEHWKVSRCDVPYRSRVSLASSSSALVMRTQCPRVDGPSAWSQSGPHTEPCPGRRAEGTNWPTCCPAQQEQEISVWSGKPLRCGDSLSARSSSPVPSASCSCQCGLRPGHTIVCGGSEAESNSREQGLLSRRLLGASQSRSLPPRCSQLEGVEVVSRERGCSRASARQIQTQADWALGLAKQQAGLRPLAPSLIFFL